MSPEPLKKHLQRVLTERHSEDFKSKSLSLPSREEIAAREMYQICWQYYRMQAMPSEEIAMRVWKLRREVK